MINLPKSYTLYLSQLKETIIKTIRFILPLTIILLITCAPNRYQEQRLALSRHLTIPVSMIIYADTAPDWDMIYTKLNSYATLFDYRRKESFLQRLNLQSTATLDPETAAMVRKAREIATSSDGAFDPTILPLTRLWNLEEEVLAPGATGWQPPEQEAVLAARDLVDYRQLKLDSNNTATLPEGYALDLGGIAKGAIVDRTADYLNTLGYTNFLIEAGGDLLISGSKREASTGWLPWKTEIQPWALAVQHPRDSSRYIVQLQLQADESRLALVTSGDYERFIEIDGVRYHHLIDPATGYPALENVSVTVLAPTCTEADALSTAAFVMGFEKGTRYLENLEGVEGLLIREQAGKLESALTTDFPAEIEELEY